MELKKFLLGTNWKMNKTFTESKLYIDELIKLTNTYEQFKYFIIPPYTHLKDVKKKLCDSNILLGAQNMHWENSGAYTGEISPLWLRALGVDIAQLGHSERRQYYNENDIDLNKKVHGALKNSLTPLLCIGEYLQDKEYGVTKEVLCRQIKIGLFGIAPKQAKKVWIAYEPVWAIGENGTSADPYYVEKVHGYIRDQLIELFGPQGMETIILYGGSVNVENCVSIAERKNVDGLFIGRSAWDINSFREIISLLENSKISTQTDN